MSAPPVRAPHTLEALREAMAAGADGWDLKPFVSGDDDLSPCPCFAIEVDGLKVIGHCWRTNYWDKRTRCRCDRMGIHVWGDPADGARLKELLDAMDWYGEWTLVMEPSR